VGALARGENPGNTGSGRGVTEGLARDEKNRPKHEVERRTQKPKKRDWGKKKRWDWYKKNLRPLRWQEVPRSVGGFRNFRKLI